MKKSYTVIGIMSGTSLDGLDIACCRFSLSGKLWKFRILASQTMTYDSAWSKALTYAHLMEAADLLTLDAAFGKFIGEACTMFIKKQKLKPDWIASHGHTVFHQTNRRMTFQLGNGNAIYAAAGIPVVYDFRRLDVALKGQGAPLVPVGDRHLFSGYDVCLNLGGIANLSLEKNSERVAYDVCYANMGLNYLASKAGKSFDQDGAIAAKGTVDAALLKSLNTVYRALRKRPALGREGFEAEVLPLLDNKSISLENKMRTFCESTANEVVKSIAAGKVFSKVLVTGGGAFNGFLIGLLETKLAGHGKLMLPAKQVIEFKEAMVFAFLGVLRVRGEVNVLKSVTRATRDSSSGVIVSESF